MMLNLLLVDTLVLIWSASDAALRKIIGRHFHGNLVPGQDTDEIGPQLAGDVR